MAEATDWMPRNWGGRRAMGEAIFKHIVDFQTELGLGGAEVAEIQDLAKELMDVIDYYDQAKAVANGLGEWRDDALATGDGGALPNPPMPGTFSTVGSPVTGVLPALRKWREKWVVADGWTQAIGETLKVVKIEGEAVDLSTFKPDAAIAAMQSGGFGFTATVTNRGEAKMFSLKAAPVGTTDWRDMGTREGRFGEFFWTDGGTDPIQLQCRIQLLLKNANYGQPSDIVLVTVIP